MSVFSDVLQALLGVSTFQPPKGYGPEYDSPIVKNIRKNLGGNLSTQPTTRIRWYLADLESAQNAADNGDMLQCGQLWRAMRRDGQIGGLMSTLTSGVAAMPKKFYGKYGVAELQARNGTRSMFDDYVPPSEIAMFGADMEALGFAIGELVEVKDRDYPVFVRLEPEFLRFRWIENRWYFNSVAGPLPITPGDGHWVLGTRGRSAPWMHGLWPALGRSFINKEHAMIHRANYSMKLANAARVATAPQGASETQKQAWFQKVMGWGMNTVFGLTPGYDVKLLESNGIGIQVFQDEIDTCDKEIAMRISGQTVTADGGVGFQNSDIFQAIQSSIIKRYADEVAFVVNTQILPAFVAQRYGANKIREGAMLEWDISRPKDMASEANSMSATAGGIKALGEALAPYKRRLDINAITTRFAIPIENDEDGDGAPDVEVDDASMPDLGLADDDQVMQ